MLTDFATLRAREFARLDDNGQAYLDYTGSALYPASAVRRHLALLERRVFGNPHSHHAPSEASTAVIDAARQAVLEYLDADPAVYTVVFTANASAAVKVVAEAFPFGPECGLVLTSDNHNSVNGIREFARRAGAPVRYVPLDDHLQCPTALEVLGSAQPRRGLFAFPAQSNFSGVRHPLTWVAEARARGYQVLLDAAAFVPTCRLSLREVEPDFVALSIYKVAGYPTGVGALVVKSIALAALHRPWFGGGSVDFVSVRHNRVKRRPGADGFEDGTPDFLAMSAVPFGLQFVCDLGWNNVRDHVGRCRSDLVARLQALAHHNGRPVVRIYGPSETTAAGVGGTVAFNVLGPDAVVLPYGVVEARAAAAGVALRGGCFCNPGAAEAAFGWPADRSGRCLDATADDFTPARFSQCLGDEWAVGALRASVGVATNTRDIDRAVEVIRTFAR
jgi:selenocysteine lyase/cysteine desulfurase